MTDDTLKALRRFQVADRKYRNGDSISDSELELLVTRYRAAEFALRDILHPTYALALTDVRRRVDELEGFQISRARKV